MVARGYHDTLDTPFGHHLEHFDDVVLIHAVEHGGVGGHTIAFLQSDLYGASGDFEHALAINTLVVRLLHAVQMNNETEIFGGRNLVHHSFHEQSVRAHIHELLGVGDTVDDLVNLRMQGRLAAGNRHDGRSRLLHRREAMFHAHHAVQHGFVLSYPATALTSKIALLQRLKHSHQGEPFASGHLLFEDVPS